MIGLVGNNANPVTKAEETTAEPETTVPDTTSEPETSAVSESTAEVTSADETSAPAEKKGCGSAVGFVAVLAVAAGALCLAKRRK